MLISVVTDLLDNLILSKGFKLRTEPKKKYFFIKVFTTSKTFAILTFINTNLIYIKIMDYCESNKQMGRVCALRTVCRPANFKEELPTPREALINTG